MSNEERDLRRLEDFEKKVRRITDEYEQKETPDAQEQMDRELRRMEIVSKIEMICRMQAEEHIRQLIEKYDRENDVDV